MKKLLVLIIAFYLFAITTIAQNTPNPPNGYRAEVQKGVFNTNFTYNPGVSDLDGITIAKAPVYVDEFTLEKVPLMGVNFGYFFNDGWEAGAGVNYGSHPWDGELSNGGKFEQTDNHFGVGAYVNYHLQSKFDQIDPYFGIFATYGSISGDRTDTSPGGETSTFESSGNSIGFGAQFGVNLYLTEGFAFSGAYNAGWLKLNSPEVTGTSGGTTTTSKGPSLSWFGTGNFQLGVRASF